MLCLRRFLVFFALLGITTPIFMPLEAKTPAQAKRALSNDKRGIETDIRKAQTIAKQLASGQLEADDAAREKGKYDRLYRGVVGDIKSLISKNSTYPRKYKVQPVSVPRNTLSASPPVKVKKGPDQGKIAKLKANLAQINNLIAKAADKLRLDRLEKLFDKTHTQLKRLSSKAARGIKMVTNKIASKVKDRFGKEGKELRSLITELNGYNKKLKDGVTEKRKTSIETKFKTTHTKAVALKAQIKSGLSIPVMAAAKLTRDDEEISRLQGKIKNLYKDVSGAGGVMGWRRMDEAKRQSIVTRINKAEAELKALGGKLPSGKPRYAHESVAAGAEAEKKEKLKEKANRTGLRSPSKKARAELKAIESKEKADKAKADKKKADDDLKKTRDERDAVLNDPNSTEGQKEAARTRAAEAKEKADKAEATAKEASDAAKSADKKAKEAKRNSGIKGLFNGKDDDDDDDKAPMGGGMGGGMPAGGAPMAGGAPAPGAYGQPPVQAVPLAEESNDNDDDYEEDEEEEAEPELTAEQKAEIDRKRAQLAALTGATEQAAYEDDNYSDVVSTDSFWGDDEDEWEDSDKPSSNPFLQQLSAQAAAGASPQEKQAAIKQAVRTEKASTYGADAVSAFTPVPAPVSTAAAAA